MRSWMEVRVARGARAGKESGVVLTATGRALPAARVSGELDNIRQVW
jgi:hypothetical protein